MTNARTLLGHVRMNGVTKVFVFLVGFLSFLWILLRVVSKPSRATYPCVQAAYPFASVFLISLANVLLSTYAYTRALANLRSKRVIPFIFLTIVATTSIAVINLDGEEIFAVPQNTVLVEPNNPIGEPKGVIPGRVVWFHHPDATNENWSTGSPTNYNANSNTNIDTVEKMISASIRRLTEKSSIQEAWNALFVYFNKEHGKGEVGYKQGERIFVKCNFVSAFTQTTTGPTWVAPQILRAILRHLVNDMSIPQEYIALGDPMVCVTDVYWNMLHSEFPNVKYIDHAGGNGRTTAEKGKQASIFYSDRGEILRDSQGSWTFPANSGDPVYSDTLYQIIEDADYLINIAPLKGHGRAGVTLCAKNHFGSHVRTTAAQLHMGLTKPDAANARFGYGQYRVLVDLMGHRKLGGNTLLLVVDGLWGGANAGSKPEKYKLPPFNNDYPSSVFMSQDQVAIESVCLDFLMGMYPTGNPQMDGVDDYLRQAADPTKWPDSVTYDPENDGTPLKSLGVHEHWNNSSDKKYSRELGIGNGIDFVKLDKNTVVAAPDDIVRPTEFTLSQNYPNPFNPVTTIRYSIPRHSRVVCRVFDVSGKEVALLENGERPAGTHQVTFDAHELASGVYYFQLVADGFVQTKKGVLTK